jgi:methyl-accepting chemotaxis protein
MDPESTDHAGGLPLPAWLAPFIEKALAGFVLVALLTIGGSAALFYGAPPEGATWPALAFAVLGGLATAFYGWQVFGFYRRLERRLPESQGQRQNLENKLIAAFEELGAFDLVRSNQHARALPERQSRALVAASEALSGRAQEIQDSSIEVASAADKVSQIAADLASGSSQQAASVVEITAAMEELARTASQIAENATRQAGLAARADASGDNGAIAVDEAVSGVEEVQKRITAISQRADALGTRSKEIYRVLELITEIAQETHILSLNAAIEAVAAGADGRRFSVVAEEVRHLAHRSQESVDSVRGLLDEFASSIRATIVATEEGMKEASRVLERSRAAATAIAELRLASGDTSRVAQQISLATQQQNAASDEVVMTLREVSLVVQRMTGGLKNLSTTADRLNHLGLTIQLLAQSFHLDSPRSLKNYVEEMAKKLQKAGSSELETQLDELVQGAPFIQMGYFVDTSGFTVALAYNRNLTNGHQIAVNLRELDMTRRPWYRIVSREKRSALTPPYESLFNGEKVFTVAAPILSRDGSFMGVVGVDINVTGWTRI